MLGNFLQSHKLPWLCFCSSILQAWHFVGKPGLLVGPFCLTLPEALFDLFALLFCASSPQRFHTPLQGTKALVTHPRLTCFKHLPACCSFGGGNIWPSRGQTGPSMWARSTCKCSGINTNAWKHGCFLDQKNWKSPMLFTRWKENWQQTIPSKDLCKHLQTFANYIMLGHMWKAAAREIMKGCFSPQLPLGCSRR